MPLRHGQKFYCQLLLDRHRYGLIERLAGQENKRPTALLREMVYAALAIAAPTEYKAAELADQEAWAESVRRRVEGRRRSKADESVESV